MIAKTMVPSLFMVVQGVPQYVAISGYGTSCKADTHEDGKVAEYYECQRECSSHQDCYGFSLGPEKCTLYTSAADPTGGATESGMYGCVLDQRRLIKETREHEEAIGIVDPDYVESERMYDSATPDYSPEFYPGNATGTPTYEVIAGREVNCKASDASGKDIVAEAVKFGETDLPAPGTPTRIQSVNGLCRKKCNERGSKCHGFMSTSDTCYLWDQLPSKIHLDNTDINDLSNYYGCAVKSNAANNIGASTMGLTFISALLVLAQE